MLRALLAGLLALCIAGPAHASPRDDVRIAKTVVKRKKRKKKAKKRPAAKKKAAKKKTRDQVTMDVGIGPAVHMFTGPIQDDQLLHYGLKINAHAIVGKALIDKNRKKIPKKFRGMTKGMKEARVGILYIPNTLYISPKTDKTAMYGATWRPLSIAPIRTSWFNLGVGLDLTYIFIDADRGGVNAEREPEHRPEEDEGFTMHFLRPGLDAQASFTLPLSKSFLFEFGWMSAFYPPQTVGGAIFELGELEDSIWHVGQAFARFHVRWPHTL